MQYLGIDFGIGDFIELQAQSKEAGASVNLRGREQKAALWNDSTKKCLMDAICAAGPSCPSMAHLTFSMSPPRCTTGRRRRWFWRRPLAGARRPLRLPFAPVLQCARARGRAQGRPQQTLEGGTHKSKKTHHVDPLVSHIGAGVCRSSFCNHSDPAPVVCRSRSGSALATLGRCGIARATLLRHWERPAEQAGS